LRLQRSNVTGALCRYKRANEALRIRRDRGERVLRCGQRRLSDSIVALKIGQGSRLGLKGLVQSDLASKAFDGVGEEASCQFRLGVKVSNHQLSWWYGGEPLKAV